MADPEQIYKEVLQEEQGKGLVAPWLRAGPRPPRPGGGRVAPSQGAEMVGGGPTTSRGRRRRAGEDEAAEEDGAPAEPPNSPPRRPRRGAARRGGPRATGVPGPPPRQLKPTPNRRRERPAAAPAEQEAPQRPLSRGGVPAVATDPDHSRSPA